MLSNGMWHSQKHTASIYYNYCKKKNRHSSLVYVFYNNMLLDWVFTREIEGSVACESLPHFQ